MAEKYYIKCGKFFDGLNEELKNDVRIITEDKRIIRVGTDIECPKDAETIDLSHLTITPGLIDAHVHFEFVGTNAFPTYSFVDSDEMKTLSVIYNAKKALEGGFTTVRILGASIGSFGLIDAKRAIDKKMFPGSRLVVAPHFLGTSGGHSDDSAFISTNPRLSEKMAECLPFVGNGAGFFKETVRKQIKYGADVIKIMGTGGFASPNDAPDDLQLDNDELKAVINTAKQFNIPTTSHAYTSKSIENLINLGISGIEHGSLMDEKTAELMVKKGVYLVCTFLPFNSIINMDEEELSTKSKAYREKLIKYKVELKKTKEIIINHILKGDMIVGYGTDIIETYNNFDCWREFKIWRESGIPPLKILKAATKINAEILENEEIGTIEEGKLADIAGWGRDILFDNEAISDCDFVMKEGTIYKGTTKV